MPFKIRDLMINIAPSESGEGTGECVTGKKTNQEGGCTGKRTDMGCPGKRTDLAICVGGRSYGGVRPAGGVPVCGRCTLKSHQLFSFQCDPAEVLDDLKAIKAELQLELAAVDEEIKEIEDTFHPKTIAEVDELQTKLREALDELGKIKADLEKK